MLVSALNFFTESQGNIPCAKKASTWGILSPDQSLYAERDNQSHKVVHQTFFPLPPHIAKKSYQLGFLLGMFYKAQGIDDYNIVILGIGFVTWHRCHAAELGEQHFLNQLDSWRQTHGGWYWLCLFWEFSLFTDFLLFLSFAKSN